MPYCLSLEDGLEIAKIAKKQTPIYISQCDYNDKPQINTTTQNKNKIFETYLRQNNKLMKKDIDMMIDAYNKGYTELNTDKPKLENKYENAVEYVNNSLKRFMNFNKDTFIYPILPKRHWIAYCFGLSGSGKSYYLSELIKNNFKNDQLVFLFSPINDDIAFQDLNIFHIHLESFEDDFGQPFDISMLSGTSKEPNIAIFDDIHTFNNKKIRNMYIDIQTQILERGRHLHIRSLSVSHNPMSGQLTKAPIRESEYYILFPSSNYRDSKVLLNTYTGLTQNEINEILNLQTRGVIVKKSIPSYYISDHNVGLLGKS